MNTEDIRFRALVVDKGGSGEFRREVRERSIGELPSGDLLVKVRFSSLNYKDALSATGHPGVTRQFPHTPGIDAAGEVASSTSGAFSPGDKVIVTGYDLGMETDGGWGGYIRVPSEWCIPLPARLSIRESMVLGTAGLTAAISVMKLEQGGVMPGDGEVLVTGATGGVGCIAVAILAKRGYRVVASSGKRGDADFLKRLGAAGVVSRTEVTEGGERPLMKERWSGAIDVAGGATLASVIKATRYGGAVACCGMVGSPELNMNVYPFILRGVTLMGVDSVNLPAPVRHSLWEKLAGPWKPEGIWDYVTETGLEGLEERIQAILAGGVKGRVLVRHSA